MAVCSLAVPACVVANPVRYAVEALGDLTLTAGPAEQLLACFLFRSNLKQTLLYQIWVMMELWVGMGAVISE